jgi:nucleoside 2-deoxyribosyltransferase
LKIYVASSWRTDRHDEVVRALRDADHDVYDYREEGANHADFEIDRDYTVSELNTLFERDDVVSVVERDMAQLATSDALVLVMPCGRSAHFEAGVAFGQGKSIMLIWQDAEPEFVYDLADWITYDIQELVDYLNAVSA